MNRKHKIRYLLAIYGIILAIAAIIAVVILFNQPAGSSERLAAWKSFWLNISTELIGAVAVFVIVNILFLLDDWDLAERVSRLLNKLERERPTADKFFHKLPDLEPFITKSQHIDLCGVSLTSAINKNLTHLRDSLSGGNSVQIMIVDPISIAVEMANARSAIQDINYFQKRLEASLNDLRYLHETWKAIQNNDGVGSLQVKLLPYAPSFGLYRFDIANEKRKILLEIYPHHAGFGAPPSFNLIEGDDGRWYEYFSNQFREMWKKGREWVPEESVSKNGQIASSSRAKAEDFLFQHPPNLTPFLKEAQDICLFGFDLSGTIRDYLSVLTKSMENGANLKIVVTSSKLYSGKQKETIEQLNWLHNNPQNKGQIEIREYGSMPHSTIFAIDPMTANGRIFVKFFTEFWKQHKQPKFELIRNRDAYWMDYFLTQFEKIWESSVPVSLE